MKVIHLSVECFPIAKVGGLADVVGALPKYQRKLGIDASVVMPYYNRPFVTENALLNVYEGSFSQGDEILAYTVWKEQYDTLGFPVYLIYIEGKLDRPEVYCYPDEAEQWMAFQHAFLDWIVNTDNKPDLINCHDHHVGLVPFLIKYAYSFQSLAGIKTVFTVHNGQYQGWLSWDKAHLLPSFDGYHGGLLDWDGVINPMATALKCCDRYTTVSEGYLEELFVEANGLQDLFKHERAKAIGIVNGIDVEFWDPAIDQLLPLNYTSTTVKKGKEQNKKIFCEKVGLPFDIPLLSYIGRFAFEKGADLLPELIREMYSLNENKIAIFILGSGDDIIQGEIANIIQLYPNQVSVFFGYNESLAHEVYAASDMLIMPSRVEPCGLNQLYALQYGTIPIVRNIGGLKDTVIDIDHDNGYGFVFEELDIKNISLTINRAISVFNIPKSLESIRGKAMKLDFSWDKSAKKYVALYNQLLK